MHSTLRQLSKTLLSNTLISYRFIEKHPLNLHQVLKRTTKTKLTFIIIEREPGGSINSLPVISTMKKVIVTYLLLAMISCSAGNDELQYSTDRNAIQFATGRANTITPRKPIVSDNLGLVTEDVANVVVLRDDSPAPFTNGIQEKTASATIKAGNVNNRNLMELAPRQYFKTDYSDVHFMAYYPEGTLSSSPDGTVDYTINGKQDIITAERATATFSPNNGVNFRFTHRLALVELWVKAENDLEAAAFGSLFKASIRVPVNLKLSIDGTDFKLEKAPASATGELSFMPPGIQPQVVLVGGLQKIGELMIYPEKVDQITLSFTHKIPETYNLQWDLVQNHLQPGTRNKITINLKAFEIKFSVTVTPWDEEGNTEEITIGGSS